MTRQVASSLPDGPRVDQFEEGPLRTTSVLDFLQSCVVEIRHDCRQDHLEAV